MGVALSNWIYQRKVVNDGGRLGTRKPHALDVMALAFEVLAKASMLG